MAAHIPDTIDKNLLGLYLSDHLTGATAGLGRIERMAKDFTDTPVHAELASVAAAIGRERELLRGLIRELGIRQRPHRQAAAWLAERAGRLKLNGRLLSRSPEAQWPAAEPVAHDPGPGVRTDARRRYGQDRRLADTGGAGAGPRA